MAKHHTRYGLSTTTHNVRDDQHAITSRCAVQLSFFNSMPSAVNQWQAGLPRACCPRAKQYCTCCYIAITSFIYLVRIHSTYYLAAPAGGAAQVSRAYDRAKQYYTPFVLLLHCFHGAFASCLLHCLLISQGEQQKCPVHTTEPSSTTHSWGCQQTRLCA
jgi:hypothetical protein